MMPPSSKSLKKSIKLMRSAGDLICRCTVAAVASMTIQPGTGLLQQPPGSLCDSLCYRAKGRGLYLPEAL